MSFLAFQLTSTFILLASALWLFAHTLPSRDDYLFRLAIVAAVIIVIAFTASEQGFSLYPTLTDDLSFIRAIMSFVVVLAVMVVTQVFLWDCSIPTALYCCSSAYLLENLSEGLVRLWHTLGVIPTNPETYLMQSVPLSDIALTVVSAVISCGLAYQLICRKLTGRALARVNNLSMLFMSNVAIMVSIIFDLAIKDVYVYNIPHRYKIVLALVHLTMGAFILMAEYEIIYNHTLQANISLIERTMAEQSRQFELSRSTIDAINRRCHDIRHHIVRILAEGSHDGTLTREQLVEVARGIEIYESLLKTGNAALDVVLTEKGLLCRQQGITLSAVADGHALDFLPAAELYALFSALLDGAYTAVHKLEDKGRRSIALNVRERMGMAVITVEHYLPTAAATAEDIQLGEVALADIQEMVERNNGTISYGDQNGETLHLNILLPQE
jgi:hypothetical protein